MSITIPQLNPGELYAGILTDEAGTPTTHVILISGENDGAAWKAAKDWAIEVGGELPTRREQALLFANLRGQFKQAWYWSSEEYESDASYAWYQNFTYGGQLCSTKGSKLRARAVRRLPI